jgi:hypothetical protein
MRKCCKNAEKEQNVPTEESELMIIEEYHNESHLLKIGKKSLSCPNGFETREGFELGPPRPHSYSF